MNKFRRFIEFTEFLSILICMTEQELILYRKCMRKVQKPKRRTRYDFELEHEYDTETNYSSFEKE